MKELTLKQKLRKKKLMRILKTLDVQCDKLERFIDQPDGWIMFQAVRLAIFDLTRDIREMNQIFKRDL